MPQTKTKKDDTRLGSLILDSGSLLITDGIMDSDRIAPQSKCITDLGYETPMTVPLYLITQNSKRYILIGIDDAIPVHPDAETIEIEP